MTNDDLLDGVHDLLFGVRRSVRYHSRRRATFDSFNLCANATALVMGSATIYGVLSDQASWVALTAASIVTVLSSLNLVIGSSLRARQHHDLARRFIDLERKIVAGQDRATKDDISNWTDERLIIEADEPPKLHVLDCICHNDLMRAMGHPPDQLAKIGFVQRCLAPMCDWREHTIKA